MNLFWSQLYLGILGYKIYILIWMINLSGLPQWQDVCKIRKFLQQKRKKNILIWTLKYLVQINITVK
jgi:hypothetical protein